MIIKFYTNNDIKTRDECFDFITQQAIKLGLVKKNRSKDLLNGFIKRESIGTTGFQDSIALPHAEIEDIKEPAVIIVRSKKALEWESLDKKPIHIAIALIIPKNNKNDEHIEILSKVSTLLLKDQFRKDLFASQDSKYIEKIFLDSLKNKEQASPKDNQANSAGSKKIVGVSACATGVAHTYMAKESLEEYGKNNGFIIHIETQGQKGQEFKLSDQQIAEADAVIIASDIYVDDERFLGKRVLKLKTNDAIKDPKKCIELALNSDILGDGNSSDSGNKKPNYSEMNFKSSKSKVFMGHLLTGVSRMIPFIVFSGIVWAILNSLSEIESIRNDKIFQIILDVSGVGFTFFISIMGGFIAESIAGKPGLAPGMISTFVASNSGFYFWWDLWGKNSGIPKIDYFFENWEELGINNVGLSLFAAILMGFSAGYLVKWVNSWKVHKLVRPIIPIVFIPVVCTSVITIPFVLLLSGPLGFMMNGLVYGISYLSKIKGVNFLMGFVLGVMIGFDMGGPINKIAGTAATALIPIDPRLMGSVAAAIPIAPIGCALATFLARNLFNEKERAEGITALGLGFFGISEGAIPFATNRPKKVLLANLIGSGLAGGLAFLFFCGGYVGMWGGPITAIILGEKAPINELNKLNITIPLIFGGAGQGMEYLSVLWFFVAIIVGSIVHALLLILGIGGKKSLKKIFRIKESISSITIDFTKYI